MLPISGYNNAGQLRSLKEESSVRSGILGNYPARYFSENSSCRGGERVRTALIFRERVLAPSETFIMEQAKPLRRFQPILVGLRRSSPALKHMLPEVLLRNGHDLVDKFAASGFRKFPINPYFFNRLRSVEPSIIHAHFAVDAIQAMSIAERLDLPLVVSLHGFDITSTDAALRTSFAGRHFVQQKQQLFDRATAFICVSRFLRQVALGRLSRIQSSRALHGDRLRTLSSQQHQARFGSGSICREASGEEGVRIPPSCDGVGAERKCARASRGHRRRPPAFFSGIACQRA
jgi:Glycosyltransferase Family 4